MIERLRIGQMLRAAVADGVAPAIAFSVSRGEAPPQYWFAGREGPEAEADPVSATTRFDLASLTKPLTTATWVLQQVEHGRLELDDAVGAHLEISEEALARVPIWRLLNHTAGLPAHRRYFTGLGPSVRQSGGFERARGALRRMLCHTALDREPGADEVYSDLGFLLLEWIAERVDLTLTRRWPDLPGHGPTALHFRPSAEPPPPAPGYAPTERCALRGRLVRGQAHDENAWVIGGVAGHAGAFGTIGAVHHMGRLWLRTLAGDGRALNISPELAREAVNRKWMHPRGTRILGWDTPTPGRSSAGQHFGRRAIGHLGFTGTSIWMDPEADVVMVLLTNRISPSRDNPGIRRLRPALHDAAWGWLGGGFT